MITDNTAGGNGGGLCPTTETDIVLRNTILWGNAAVGLGHQLYVIGGTAGMPSSATLSYCDYADGARDIYEEGSALAATDCITDNPWFVNPAARDYHLGAFSNCIDNGSNSHVPGGITTDLDGGDRIVNDTVDIGPYEQQ